MEKKNKELVDLIDAAIVTALETSEPTVREVYESFVPAHEDVIREFGFDLALRQVLSMFSERMKKVVEINRESTGQLDLPFSFEGIPPSITFEVAGDEGAEFRYIPLSRATEWHLSEYEGILERQITADSGKLRAVKELHRALADTFAKHPGVTVAEACALYREGAA